jgi:molybdenum cofactor biosynthesis protein B
VIHLHNPHTPNSNPKDKHIKDKNLPIHAILLLVGDTLAAATDIDRQKLDKSGEIAHELIIKHGFQILKRIYVPDEHNAIKTAVNEAIGLNAELILTMGGTGISPRDVTIEAIKPILEKELPGFGEIFRSLSYQEVGSVAIMTRTLAGIVGESVIVCLPGSPNAVKMGVSLILNEIIHLINLLKKPNLGTMPTSQF